MQPIKTYRKKDGTDYNRHVKGISVWLFPEQIEKWDTQRKLESSDSDKPILWSRWIFGKTEAALTLFEPQNSVTTNNDYLEAQIQNLKHENSRLSEKVSQLQSREVGLNEDRLLRFLSKDYIDFEDLVQSLIDTEKEATFEALQRLALKGIVDIDNYGKRWRLKK
jgi:predicted RNase H-like nuclease (RuvC/YqgF family)